LQRHYEDVVEERDKALAEVEQWRSAYNRLSKLCSDKVERVTQDHDKARAEFNRLTKERDAARSEVEQLKQALHDARLENSGQAARIEELKRHIGEVTEMVRPEPSRLEIAAMLLADGFYVVETALAEADALIAAAKEKQ
jgi:chromosome segregation ATPase